MPRWDDVPSQASPKVLFSTRPKWLIPMCRANSQALEQTVGTIEGSALFIGSIHLRARRFLFARPHYPPWNQTRHANLVEDRELPTLSVRACPCRHGHTFLFPKLFHDRWEQLNDSTHNSETKPSRPSYDTSLL